MKPLSSGRLGARIHFWWALAFAAFFVLACADARAATTATISTSAWTMDGDTTRYGDQASCVAAASAKAPAVYTCRYSVIITVALQSTGMVAFVPWMGPADAATVNVLGYHIWAAQALSGGVCPPSDTAVAPVPPSPWKLMATVTDPAAGAQVIGLVNGVRWCFKVTAFNAAGDSTDSFIVYRDVP